jgi:hypothetical protein
MWRRVPGFAEEQRLITLRQHGLTSSHISAIIETYLQAAEEIALSGDVL